MVAEHGTEPASALNTESVRKLVVPDLEQTAGFVDVRPVKYSVTVEVFDSCNGSQSPSEVRNRMEAPDGNALALT